MNPLSPRQQSILNRVIETHIETAQPVGSRFITEVYTGLYRSSYSPATVRYEMGRLEGLGYLMHPHTSAGRVPTDQGYRYYVDHSLQDRMLPQELRRLGPELMAEGEEGLAEKASEVLSDLAGEVTVLVFAAAPSGVKPRFFLQGTSRLMEKPEFQDVRKVRILFQTFEKKSELGGWLRDATPERGVGVRIGRENELEALQPCSVISAHFRGGRASGTLALIGPRRMNYLRAVPLVRQTARILQSLLEDPER